MKLYRADLDAIKAFAIIAVVLYHMGLLKSGYLGVDIFFVINGFFILPSMCMLFTQKNDGENGGLLPFWVKRIMRLWPLILIASLFSLCVGYYGMLPDDYENLSEAVIASNLFSENILEAITTKNYWDIQNEYKPLMHMWYVGVLVEFYIFTPIVLWLANRIARRKGVDTNKYCVMLVYILTLLSFFYYLSPLSEGPGRFYYLPARFWEIALGGLVALNFNKLRNLQVSNNKLLNTVISLLLLFIICVGLVWPYYHPTPALIITAFLTTFLLFANPENNIFKKILTWQPLCVIGKMSFSIFVWHQVLLAFYRYFVSEENTISFVLLFWCLVLFVSCISYLFVEKKIRPTRRSFALAASFMVLIAIPSTAIFLHAGVVRDVPELNISFSNVHRHMHAEYVDRIYSLDKGFSPNSKLYKVLVVGDSYARDWANILLESSVSDIIEISYSFSYNDSIASRIKQCDVLFSRGLKSKIPLYVWDELRHNRVFGIGTKEFGTCNGSIYRKRHDSDYFDQMSLPEAKVIEDYGKEKMEWGEYYIDMLKPVSNNEGLVRIFTPNHKFISQDCRHLTEEGAKYYASLIQFDRFFE